MKLKKTSITASIGLLLFVGCATTIFSTSTEKSSVSVTPVKKNTDKDSVKTLDNSNLTEEQRLTSEMLSYLDDSDKVIKLSNGGYLHGQATITDLEGKIIGEYDSETDANAETVAEAIENAGH